VTDVILFLKEAQGTIRFVANVQRNRRKQDTQTVAITQRKQAQLVSTTDKESLLVL